MAIYPIGNQTIEIVTTVPILDGDGQPTYTEMNEPITTDAVRYWRGCVLEMQTVTEQQGASVTTSEIAIVVGPCIGDHLPTVDEDGEPASMAVSDLNANQKLRESGRTYVMRNDAVLQRDNRGRADHVECLCEREST